MLMFPPLKKCLPTTQEISSPKNELHIADLFGIGDKIMPNEDLHASRREFLKTSTGVAIGTAIAATMAIPRSVHAGVGETMKIGLVGCGGRGTGAAQNAL